MQRCLGAPSYPLLVGRGSSRADDLREETQLGQISPNLNTGGNNYDETQGVVAHTATHHSKEYPSSVTLTLVKK